MSKQPYRFGRWISVDDDMPEDNSWVLVCADGAMNCMWFKGNGIWEDLGKAESHNIIISDITYWMPLPNQPLEFSKEFKFKEFL